MSLILQQASLGVVSPARGSTRRPVPVCKPILSFCSNMSANIPLAKASHVGGPSVEGRGGWERAVQSCKVKNTDPWM